MKPNQRAILLGAVVIVLTGFLAYQNSFRAPFLFDDEPSILENATIHHLWPLSAPLSPPRDYGVTVSGRPLVNLTLALNYAISGEQPWSYHVFNLVIHLLAGLVLFGIVRRTLLSPVLRQRYGSHATVLALAVALLWTLHPLQTESVTYVIQRTESLMGLFFLLTFSCFIRAVEPAVGELAVAGGADPGPTSGKPESATAATGVILRRNWAGFSVIFCLCGMASKEVMVAAPLLVLLYDRTFVAGTFREAWRRHRALHLSLMATWLLLFALVASTGGDRGGTFKFTTGLFATHLFTQFESITRYLGLSVWPHPLVFEYGAVSVNSIGTNLFQVTFVLAVVAATLVSLWRWPVLGFLGCWFFAILAPTSLVPSTLQLIVEHRMYLPLAAVLTLIVGVGFRTFGARVLPCYFALALAAGWLTARRNTDYASDLTIWADTVTKRPDGPRAQTNLGKALFARGDLAGAILHYERALELDPETPTTQFNLGLALEQSGRLAEAATHYLAAAQSNPRLFQAQYKAGMMLARLGRPTEAEERFQRALEINPGFAAAHAGLGAILLEQGRAQEAIQQFTEAIRFNPRDATVLANLGVAWLRMGNFPEATVHLEEALKLDPTLADAQFNLALTLAQSGHAEAAHAHYAEAVRLNPSQAEAQLNLGIAEAQAGRLESAVDHLQAAVRLKPRWPEAHGNLGAALDELGRVNEARVQYEEALRLKPDYEMANANLMRLGRRPPGAQP